MHANTSSDRRSHVAGLELLSGLDASFLHLESDSAPMHTLKVLVLRLPADARDVAATVVRRIEGQLDRLRALRVRPRAGLFGRIAWEPVHVHVADHVEHRIVWGGARERTRALDELASRPLRRDRPLWELVALEDRRARELVLALKIHHALADGKAAAHLLELAAGVAPTPAPERRPAKSLLALALVATLAALRSLPRTLARTVRGLVRMRALARATGARPTRPFGGPPTSFTGPVTAARRTAVASLSLEDVLEVKRAAGVTLNDVVLALSAGALRRYLEARGEAIDRPLVAAMPVGVEREAYAIGNRLSNVLVPLHVDEPRPWTRLERTSRSASHAKALHAALGADLLLRWSELVPRSLSRALWRLVRWSRRAPVDLVVSSVPGPREPLTLGGAALERIYSVGPLLETTGLNLTFWSYAGQLHACVLTCADHASDPQAIADALIASLDELRHARTAHSERQAA